MSSLAARAKSELYNPVAMYRFLDAATKSISIDSGLGGIRGLYDLANRLRSMQAHNLRFITLPTYPPSLVDPADTANVALAATRGQGDLRLAARRRALGCPAISQNCRS